MNLKTVITTDANEREKAYAIRCKVFVEEQNVPLEMEIDEYDCHVDTKHVLLINNEEQVIGAARFRPYRNGILKIERVAVLSEQREHGAGRTIGLSGP